MPIQITVLYFTFKKGVHNILHREGPGFQSDNKTIKF